MSVTQSVYLPPSALLGSSEMLADSTSVTVSGSTPPPAGGPPAAPFLLPPPRGLIMNPAAYLAAGAAAPFLYGNNALSYAREWQNKLRELQDSKAAAAAILNIKRSSPNHIKEHLTSLAPHPAPIVSITPSLSSRHSPKSNKASPPRKQESPIKMDSNGALNLASPSSPTDFSSSAPHSAVAAMADTSIASRSPPNFAAGAASGGGRAGSNFGVEICVVCGDRASGRHYGAISCEGCKGFFKRSIRKQLGYQCRGNRDCEVTKHHRNRCQYCRLQKCLAMGMRSDSVQSERRPNAAAAQAAAAAAAAAQAAQRNSPNNRTANPDISLFGMYDSPSMLPRTPIAPETLLAASSSAASENSFSAKNDDGNDNHSSTENGSSNGDHLSSTTTLDASTVLAARDKSLISRAMDTVARTVANSDEEGEQEEQCFEVEGKLLADQLTKFQLSTPSPMPSYLNVHFICETASRLLFLSIHWVRSIPSFSRLSYETQVGLVRNAWSDLFVLGMAQCSQSMNLQNILTAIVSHLQTSVAQEKLTAQRVRQVTTTICKVQEYVRAMAKMNIDDHEFAYLKTIALFGTDQLGISCPKQIEKLKNKTVIELREYCSTSKGGSSTESESRFSNLLLRLAPLRSLQPDVLEELFFAGLIGNVQIDSVVPYILKMETSEYQAQFGGGETKETPKEVKKEDDATTTPSEKSPAPMETNEGSESS